MIGNHETAEISGIFCGTAGNIYCLARENEIKTVRIILTGKQNQFPEEAIQEKGSGDVWIR